MAMEIGGALPSTATRGKLTPEQARTILMARIPTSVKAALTLATPAGAMNDEIMFQKGFRYLLDTAHRRGDTETVNDILTTACNPHFNKPTSAQAVTLARIAMQEAPITVRGVFYRAVSQGLYPDTADKHYRQCGNLLVKLRRTGILPYSCIVDSTRRRLKPSSWSGLSDYAETVAESYRKDLWARQADYVEILVEKDAMAAVIEPVTARYDIHLNVIRGGCSESFVWQIAQQWQSIEKPIYAYYLGDFDPAGLSIEADLRGRLGSMGGYPRFNWQRIAIDENDFKRSDLIGFPVKGDRTSKGWHTKFNPYLERFGDRCVEVDAIPGAEIRARLQTTIERHIDEEQWQRLKGIEEAERESFREFVLAQKIY